MAKSQIPMEAFNVHKLRASRYYSKVVVLELELVYIVCISIFSVSIIKNI